MTPPDPAAGAPADLRVLVVDDNEAFVRAVVPVIEATPGLRVAAVAASGGEALEILAHQPIDLVLLDVHMQPMPGVEVARRHARSGGAAQIVLMSTASIDELPDAIHGAGVAGFLAKESLSTRTLAQLRRTLLHQTT